VTLSFDASLAAARLSASDRALARLIQRVGPCTLQPRKMQSPFEALARAIIYQQLSGRAAATIYGRIQDLFPGSARLEPESILAVSDARLRAAGVSRPKVRYLKDLASRSLDGTVPGLRQLRRMDDEQIVERLTSVRGVGRWTVEMLLIFRLGRPDVLPVDDLGIRKGFQRIFRTGELPAPARMHRRAERWRPFRTVASWYLWRSLDTPG
jgi:3-methyladenine DNA glycosylase/8-oxoguanine DNA glycosylase